MSKIKLLPEILINQIAAGEVVERPASVIKELVENAIDAGANRLYIEVNDGGDTFMRVTDDGEGMDKDDALMAFERHATSKILTTDDLFNIRSLGFRGEAIASIASVSYMTMQTKKHGAIEGTLIQNEGGKITNVKTIGVPEGTQFEVRNLFYNTPARKKYLKNVPTEFGHILDTVTGIALSFPQVAFKLMHDNKVVFDLPATEDLLSRTRAILGKNIADELVPVFYGGSSIQLSGFIGKPIVARASRGSQYLFVNNREVKSHVLAYAVKQSYHSLLPKEKYPVFLLYFQIDPKLVDVNVHPRKQEVRFSDEKEIFKIVLQACQKSLENNVLAPKISSDAPENYYQNRTHQGLMPVAEQAGVPTTQQNVVTIQQSGLSSGQNIEPDQHADLIQKPQQASMKLEDKPIQIVTEFQSEFQPSLQNQTGLQEPKDESKSSIQPQHTATQIAVEKKIELTALAQLNNSYILCQQNAQMQSPLEKSPLENGLIIIDQHAAHERIRYTEILAQFESTQKATQPLLMPLQFELSHQEVAVLKENLQILQNMGFELQEFGGNTFSIYAVPTFIAKEDLQKTILGLIDDFKNQAQKGDFQNRKEKALTYMACRSAVKFGDKLSSQEQQALVEKLLTLDLPYTCPHGRPTMITMSFEELERRFGRKYI